MSRSAAAAAEDFTTILHTLLARFFRQNDQPAPSGAVSDAFAARLRALIAERGLPPPLPADEIGKPGGMSDAECAPLIARVVDADAPPLLAEAARQLVKACFYPEFRVCRDSYRECAADGACRRQQWPRVRTRISGTHCIDCPYWVALEPAPHAEMLAQCWVTAGEAGTGAEAFRARQEAFLPEDFRALRLWLHTAARRPDGVTFG